MKCVILNYNKIIYTRWVESGEREETKLSRCGEPKFQVWFKEVLIFNISYTLNMIILN